MRLLIRRSLTPWLLPKSTLDSLRDRNNPSSYRVNWDDIGCLKDVRKNLQGMIYNTIEHPDKFYKFGMSPSQGVLFYIPPGCVKILLTKGISHKCSSNFIYIKRPELLTMWFCESEAINIRKVSDNTRGVAPGVLFLEGLDSDCQRKFSGCMVVLVTECSISS